MVYTASRHFVNLLRAIPELEKLKLPDDQMIGVNIIKRAIEEPARQIAINAGKEGSVIVEEVRRHDFKLGYNAADHTYVDMFEAGIVDPKMVTRSALQNAASIAAIMLTTEAIVAELPEEKKDAAAGMGGGMGGMGMM